MTECPAAHVMCISRSASGVLPEAPALTVPLFEALLAAKPRPVKCPGCVFFWGYPLFGGLEGKQNHNQSRLGFPKKGKEKTRHTQIRPEVASIPQTEA